MSRIQSTLLAALLAALFATGAGARAADLVLAAEGKSNYQIVVPDAAPTPAIGACLGQVARLVQTAFKANGSDVPVVAAVLIKTVFIVPAVAELPADMECDVRSQIKQDLFVLNHL